jgi:hypothetical protein
VDVVQCRCLYCLAGCGELGGYFDDLEGCCEGLDGGGNAGREGGHEGGGECMNGMVCGWLGGLAGGGGHVHTR